MALWSFNVVLVMLLVLVCGNVALMMFARAATREGEIAVRNALGASRGRIVLQLFVEAVVLASVAAAAGLSAVRFLLRWWLAVHEIDAGGRLPFWFNDGLAPATVLYAVGLAVIGAVIAGVLPALKVTGRNVEARLRQASAGGGGLQFGGLWTAVIVSQVALTVAVPATAFLVRRQVVQVQSFDSVMSLTVSRRTREIGIRVALGARPRRVVLAILRRPLAQVGLGVVAGGGLTAALAFGAFGGDVWPTGGALVAAYAVLMMAVCMLACLVPMRRALQVQPIDALRAE